MNSWKELFSEAVTSAFRQAITSAAVECEQNNEVGIFSFHFEYSNTVYAY